MKFHWSWLTNLLKWLIKQCSNDSSKSGISWCFHIRWDAFFGGHLVKRVVVLNPSVIKLQFRTQAAQEVSTYCFFLCKKNPNIQLRLHWFYFCLYVPVVVVHRELRAGSCALAPATSSEGATLLLLYRHHLHLSETCQDFLQLQLAPACSLIVTV